MSKTSLRYVPDGASGIKRRRSGKGFTYKGPDGKAVSKEDRERIDALAIPPAWKDVWISTDPHGHIQATGYDDRGRKQYIYHEEWSRARSADKFDRLESFGKALPSLRAALGADLASKELDRDKVVAAIVRVMERTFARVGSERYARENESYGVSTLETEHVEITRRRLHFRFPGKGGKCQDLDLEDQRVVAVVRQCQELPGERLFEYEDEDGDVHEVGSADVNAYLRETMDGPFSSKDFRTWAATTLMLQRLLAAGPRDEEKEREVVVREAVKEVAEELGNTPAVCKQSYIHPAVPAAYLDGSLEERVADPPHLEGLWPEERLTLALLDSYRA